MELPQIMTVKEVADYLRLSERTVLEWAQKGHIPCGKLGGSWRFKRDEVDRWLDQRITGKSKRYEAAPCDLHRVLRPERVTILRATSKREALEALIDVLAECPSVRDRDELHHAVFHRERLMSTGIGLGVAVPHVRLASVDAITMAAGISREGLEDYEALDGEPVKLIFMIAGGRDQHADYLRLLAELSRKIKNEALGRRLVEAPDGQTFFDILIEEPAASGLD